jgi:hypothetical protein
MKEEDSLNDWGGVLRPHLEKDKGSGRRALAARDRAATSCLDGETQNQQSGARKRGSMSIFNYRREEYLRGARRAPVKKAGGDLGGVGAGAATL